MVQSVVIYWPDGEPSAEQIHGLKWHFDLQYILENRSKDIPPHDHLIITPKHAHRAAQAAGALYMGREFALKKAGLLK